MSSPPTGCTLLGMQPGSERKCCHVIWMTRGGRSWFKIAAAARFCEHAVRRASLALGWRAEVVAVLPDRVHVLVAVPPDQDRRTISRTLQRAATGILVEAEALPRLRSPIWEGDGWCAVLPTASSVATVRTTLRRRIYESGAT